MGAGILYVTKDSLYRFNFKPVIRCWTVRPFSRASEIYIRTYRPSLSHINRVR